MWFIISKYVLYLVLPPSSLMLVMAAGLSIVRQCPRCGRTLIALGFVPLYLFSISPVSDALMHSLEADTRPLTKPPRNADAIVVLGGGVTDIGWTGQPAEPSCEALARLVQGMALYRKLHRPLVLAGGNGDPSRKVAPDAEAMRRIAREAGVPPADILLEKRSRNTIESARNLKRLLRGKRIILVTSAYHMKRAAAMFARSGFEVIPAPAPYLSERRKQTLFSFIPRAASLRMSSIACREYLSLFWYKRTGDI